MKPKLECTTNYGLFEMHEFNRPLHANSVLMDSMRENGFAPSSAIHVVKNGSGKFKIIEGHHRFDCAKRLGLPVWYIQDNTVTDVFKLEGGPGHSWSVRDFLCARAKAGDSACQQVLHFQKKHGLTQGTAIALVGGEAAGSGNKIRTVKAGGFRVGDMTHGKRVVKITDTLRGLGIQFATASSFVKAVSSVLHVKEFDDELFMSRVRLHPTHMRKSGTWKEYLTEIENVYNHGASSKRIPLAFLAIESGRKRQADFGGRNRK